MGVLLDKTLWQVMNAFGVDMAKVEVLLARQNILNG